jgi:hypothetical protein
LIQFIATLTGPASNDFAASNRIALDGETLRKPPEKSAKRGKLDTDNAE